MKIRFDMMREIFSVAVPWRIWVIVMLVVNMSGGLVFITILEGQLALLSLMGASIVMAIIYHRYGFVRLMGWGHILFWTPLIVYFIWVIKTQNPSGIFYLWLLSTTLVNGLSLLLDITDVTRYYLGDKYLLPNEN